MAEPSTPSPSEPPPESGTPEPAPPADTGAAPQPPLERPKVKLRKILTPLSPHLTAPRPERDPRLQPKEPHEPIPRAVPIEPEPEPLPLQDPEQAQQPPDAGEPAPAAAEPAQMTEQDQPDQAAEEAAPPAGEPAPAKAPAPRRRSRALLAGAAGLLLAAIATAYFLIDPFGEDLQPIQPMPTTAVTAVPAAAKPPPPPPAAQVANPAEATIEGLLEQLRGQRLRYSANPRGVFVNSVFVPEGAVLQPKLGLVLTRVDTTGQVHALLIEDSYRNTYRVEFNP